MSEPLNATLLNGAKSPPPAFDVTPVKSYVMREADRLGLASRMKLRETKRFSLRMTGATGRECVRVDFVGEFAKKWNW